MLRAPVAIAVSMLAAAQLGACTPVTIVGPTQPAGPAVQRVYVRHAALPVSDATVAGKQVCRITTTYVTPQHQQHRHQLKFGDHLALWTGVAVGIVATGVIATQMARDELGTGKGFAIFSVTAFPSFALASFQAHRRRPTWQPVAPAVTAQTSHSPCLPGYGWLPDEPVNSR